MRHDLASLLTTDDAAPLFWPPARLGVGSAWYGHVPFAHWLVSAMRPRLIVELGTHHGVSFTAFCEAVRRNALAARCIAVDLWQGDAHAGYYGESVYADLASHVARHYGGFAELRRLDFTAAAATIEDGSVDLLHIDGRHRYDDVRQDYRTWRGKLSARGVVLFHDIAELRDDFGVHRFWRELTEGAAWFAFDHAHGLGVLSVGDAPDASVEELCALRHAREGEALRRRMECLGARWVGEMRVIEAAAAEDSLRRHVAELQAHIDALGAYAARLERAQAG